MSKKNKIKPQIRNGKPEVCISCGKPLHKKSEYYCSSKCYELYKKNGKNIPPYLSKWKIRKVKVLKDPFLLLRNKTRKKSKNLVKEGKIKKLSCPVCGNPEVIIHHEDYCNPYRVIFLCEEHHKAYHDGKIGLYNNKLWWNPNRLIPKIKLSKIIDKKYKTIKTNFKKIKKQNIKKIN